MRICSLAIKVLHIFVACLIVGSSLGWFPASVNASSRTQAPDFSIYSSLTQNTAIESSPIASNPLYSPANGTWEVTDTIHLSGTERPLQIAVAGGKAYISRNPGQLTVLNLSTNAVVTTISFDPYPGAAPHYIGILGDKAYVALGNLGSDGQLAVINIGNNTVAGYIPVGADPYGVATLDQKVYVTNNVWWSSGDPATVKVVNASTNSVVATIPVGINPTGIAVDPVSKKAYVTNRNDLSKSVSVINTNANSVIATIPINNPPAGVAISGNRAYVTTVVNMPNGTVEVIDIGSDTLISSIPVGRDSWGIAASNDYVFVANQSSSTVSVIEVATNSVVATVNVGDDPTHIAVDPSTSKVYVSNQGDNTISVIQFKETAPPSNQPPAVSITSPPNVATVSGAVSVQGTASDPDGNSQLQRVEVKVGTGGWTQASGTTSWSYSWDTTTIPNGQHSIYARSYDGQAYSSETSVVVTVSNQAVAPSIIDVGITAETILPPETFLQAKPGDRFVAWYDIAYSGPRITVKLRTTIIDSRGKELRDSLGDPGLVLMEDMPGHTGWVGDDFKIPDTAVTGTYDVKFAVLSEDGAQEFDTIVKSDWLRLGSEEKPDIGSVASINFGDVTVGSNSDKTTTVHNDGSTTLTINSITRTAGSADFTYISPSTPFNVGVGSSQTVTIRFAPGSEGSKSAIFNINSNDLDEANVTFNVSGIGVAQKGTINVTSDPSGASFTLSGPANYSGITPWSKTDAPVGSYTITWTPISGYQTPPQESKTLNQGGIVSFQGDYQVGKGTIEVNSNPSGASFTLSGPANYSGITPYSKTDAMAGTYTINWGFVSGYEMPPQESKTLTQGGMLSFYGDYTAKEPFPGASAATLWEYYSAWGKALPPLSERAKIYEALGLGSAESYTGTAEQNTRLLNALKERQICPLTGEEVGWVAPQATLADLIQQQATGGIPVTVDGELYIILTLKNSIDPVTLEIVPGSGPTKVYVYGDSNNPVSEKEVAQKIGIIEEARRLQQTYGSPEEIEKASLNLIEMWNAHEQLEHWLFARESLVQAPSLFIRAYLSGGTLALKDLVEFAEQEMQILVESVSDPKQLLYALIYQDFDDAAREYHAALKIAVGGEITDSVNALSYLEYLFNADLYYSGPAYSILAKLDDIQRTILGGVQAFIADVIIDTAFDLLDCLGNYYGNLEDIQTIQQLQTIEELKQIYEVIKVLEETRQIKQITEYVSAKALGSKQVKDVLNRLHTHAAYTLELAQSPRLAVEVYSPVELRVYDSEQRVTGLVNGEERNEIPYSVYHDNSVTIFSPTDLYDYEVVGTGEGSYDLAVTTVAEKTSTFTLSDVPTSDNAVHQYTIDWETLATGKKGVTMKIDSDGDGTFEETRKLGSEGAGFSLIWIIVAAVSGLVGVFVGAFTVRRRTGEKQAA